MRRLFLVLLLLALATGALARENYNLTGQGARAMGMGGAFIGIADDATAISWNPAGLAHLDRPEVSGAFKYETQKTGWDPKSYTSLGQIYTLGEDQNDSHFVLNFASGVFPLKLKQRNLTLALAYQQQLDFFGIDSPDTIETYKQSGGANTLSPGLAYRITPKFAVGGAVNYWTGATIGNYTNFTDPSLNYQAKQPYSGLNFTFGGWGYANPVKLGAVLRTPLTLKYHNEFTGSSALVYPRRPVSGEYKAKFPFMFGVGLGWEINPNLTLAADVDFRPYSGMERQDSAGVADTSFHPMSIIQIHLGAEHLVRLRTGTVGLRLGFRTDPRTYTGYRVDQNGMLRSNDKQVSGLVFSCGSGFTAKHFRLDGAFEYGSVKAPLEFHPSILISEKNFNFIESSMRILLSGSVRF